MSSTLPIIQSLWIGDDLTNLEKLCVQSFIDHGHEFHLYTYADIGGIPEGAVVKDGNEILPESAIFKIKGGRIAPFSDWFRYTMLAKNGGFWVDMDYVCLRPFDFASDIVFAPDSTGYYNAIIKFPAGHECMTELAAACANTKHREKIRYATFYRPLTKAIRRFNLQHHAVPNSTFFPLETDSMSLIFEIGGDGQFGKRTYGMHIANGKTKDLVAHFKDANFPADSLFEKLKRKHKIAPVVDAPNFTHEEVSAMFVRAAAEKTLVKEKTNKKRRRKQYVIAAVSLLVGFLLGMAIFL